MNGDSVEVNIDALDEGPPRSAGRKREPAGDFCTDNAPEGPEGFFQD